MHHKNHTKHSRMTDNDYTNKVKALKEKESYLAEKEQRLLKLEQKLNRKSQPSFGFFADSRPESNQVAPIQNDEQGAIDWDEFAKTMREPCYRRGVHHTTTSAQ